MKPKINKTRFGEITIEKQDFDYDIIIRLSGEIQKRKKKLSKEVFGTSHKISKEEAEYVFEEGVEKVVIGTGQSGMVRLSKEAKEFFASQGCKVKLLPTPEAIEYWNNKDGKIVGLFHITC